MTETAATAGVYRPSPRPRPAGQSRPDSAHLHVVPEPTLQPETAAAKNTPRSEDSQVSDVPGTADSAIPAPVRSRIAEFRAASRAYWTPPAIFTERPPALTDLAVYARHAPWTHQQAGILRKAGVGYQHTVAIPYTVISRYREWLVQRPLRLAALAGGIKVFSLTGPGIWVVDHIVYPAARIAGHILL